MTDPIEVSQRARDAAAKLRVWLPPLAGSREISDMRDGLVDDGAYVQAFARFEQATRDDALEMAAGVADEACKGRVLLFAENGASINASRAMQAEELAAAIRALKGGGL